MINSFTISIDNFQLAFVHGSVVDHGAKTMQTQVVSQDDGSVGSSELGRGGYVFCYIQSVMDRGGPGDRPSGIHGVPWLSSAARQYLSIAF